MNTGLPCHINELVRELTLCKDTSSVLNYYSRYLQCDSFLHSLYIELGYNPEKGKFIDSPPVSEVLEGLYSEYSCIQLPLKRVNSDSSDSSNEKLRNSKGLKTLSARVKSILINKRPTSYREVAEELILEMNAVSKSEEKNILRRVYDALNVLIAADVVIKKDLEYCWKENTQTNLDAKRANLKSIANKYYSIISLMQRNLQMQKPSEILNLPLLVVATDEVDNRLKIESSSSSSIIRIKLQKKVSIHKDCDLLPYLITAHSMPQELLSIL